MFIRAVFEIIVLLVAGAGLARLGIYCSKKKPFIWLPLFVLPFGIIIAVVILNRMPDLSYRLPLFWFGEGRNEFIIMALCVPFIFGILIPQLRQKRQKLFVSVFTGLGTIYFLIPPFLEPALLYYQFQNHENWIEDDVCMQQTGFTCGPAAAVTALKQIGINGNEGDIAIASYTTHIWGTPAVSLASGIEALFGPAGIQCHVQRFDSIEELKDKCPVIAIIKYRSMVDHYVTVMEVSDETVTVGDPLKGKETLTYNEFLEKWRMIGIVVKQESVEMDS